MPRNGGSCFRYDTYHVRRTGHRVAAAAAGASLE